MTKFYSFGRVLSALVFWLVLGTLLIIPVEVGAQSSEPIKLIFIHHSCGENWLTDDHGGLGLAMGENNYFVSDTNYGWGPDSIGDRTDITNWPEWFTGPDSGRILAALYSESGQNSWYTRNLPDPGGENQIIMFKSCFPNSNLEGSPNDPPTRGGDWLSVGNAKAIYNELLGYFATRPDKLFIAVTAPPVQDPTFSANARAFNTWLVTEWLDGYQGSNVAVFDFYNLLTGPDNHHRLRDGAVEYITGQGGDTLYYPTNGDDHPSRTGNRKATEEFVPLLNYYVQRWSPDVALVAATQPPPTQEPPPESPPEEPAPPTESTPAAPPPTVPGVIDDFESEVNEWVAFDDGSGDSRLTCGREAADAYSGSAGLRIEYDVAPEGWASCSLVYPAVRDWRGERGLALYLRAGQVGQPVTIVVYQGDSPDALGHFEFQMETNQEAVDGWQRLDILWEQMEQPPWEGDGAASFDPGRTMGLAFMFDSPNGRNSGTLWVDDISFLSAVPPAELPPVAPAPTEAPEEPVIEASVEEAEKTPPESAVPEPEPTEKSDRPGVCPGSIAMGLAALVGVVWTRRKIV